MTKGRKPKPARLKVIDGNPGGKAAVAAQDLKAPIEQPQPPNWLSKDVRAIWDEILPELERLGVTARVDVYTIATYCTIMDRKIKAQMFIDEHGLTYITKGPAGTMERIRPQVKMMEDCEKQLRAYAAEFGMTPSSRTRLKGDPRQGSLFPDDPTAGYF